MEEFPRKGRSPSYDEEDFDGISRLLGMNAEEDESDNDSSNFWKEKLDHTIYALESCEKNKQLIEKQNELLRRENDEHRLQSEEFKARLTMLNEKYKVIEEERDKLKGSNLQISERFSQLEHDLSVEKEKTKRFEIKLGENETIKNELMKENCSLKEVYEKIIAKTKALEEFANELISVKAVLESKLEVCHDKMSDKEKEVRLLENTIQVQAGEIDKLENTVGEVSVEVENLKDAFEKCQQKNLEAGESIIDLRETFTAQNKKLSDECYSQAVRLEKSYSDCDLFCKRIEELETTLVGAQKDCDREAEILQETLNFTEEELKIVKDEKMVIKEEVKKLEIQVSSYREEIKNLRELLAEERSARLEVEGFRDKWETDCKDHSRELEELKSSTQELKAELLVQKQSNEMTEEGLREMRREKMGLMDEVEKMRQQRERELDEAAVLNAKLDELVEENYKLKEEIAQLRDDNAKLAGQNEQAKAENQWLGSMNEDSKAEASVLRSNLEKLKNHVWRLQQSAINAAAEEESKEKLKEHCSDLEEEKRGLIKMVDDLKLERSRLEKVNEGVNESIWKMKQEQLVLQSKCKELEKMVEERQHERKSILWKVEEMKNDHKQSIIDVENKWEEKLVEKEKFYEKQLKKKEANEILIRRMEEKLRQKEMQLEVKKGELKRILLQYSDLKNDKIRCEKKIESLQLTEKSLSTKIEQLEPRVIQLQQTEKDLIKQIEEKELEKQKLNESWGKVALEVVIDLKKAMWN